MQVHAITRDAIERHSVDELPGLLARDDVLVWVDVPTSDDEAKRVLTQVFGLHPPTVRECEHRNRVPKLHAYPEYLMVVLHGPARGERGHVHYVELDQVIGRNYLVTIHGPVNPAVSAAAAVRETESVRARIEAGKLRPGSALELSGAIVSALGDRQEEYVETVTSDVWQLEQRVTAGNVGEPEEFLTDMFRTRHGLLAVRTMAALGGAIYDQMRDLPDIPGEQRPLVANLAERFDRIRTTADGEREYLQGVLEFYQSTLTVKATLTMRTQNERIQRLTEASYAQNEQVKKISAWAAIFFAPTFIATVYGMNFEHMPELHWAVGYPLSLVAMVLAAAVLYWAFKRQRWL